MKEAREIILAFTAGAKLVGRAGKPLRNTTTKDLQYTARTWLLAESTIATPAFVGQPGELASRAHQAEWILYRDGPRNIDQTIARRVEPRSKRLRPAQPGPRRSDRRHQRHQEPVMTVVYVAANDMMHAFRAGPAGVHRRRPPARPPASEGGGRGAVGLRSLRPAAEARRTSGSPQSRVEPDLHALLVPALRRRVRPAVRTRARRPRESLPASGGPLMFVGRGPGGKYMTGLDITGPGPFTRKALETRLPTVLWNRGNPDTDDGLTTGPDNKTTNAGNRPWRHRPYGLRDHGRDLVRPRARARRSDAPRRIPSARSGSSGWAPASATSRREGRKFYTIDVVDRRHPSHRRRRLGTGSGFAPTS